MEPYVVVYVVPRNSLEYVVTYPYVLASASFAMKNEKADKVKSFKKFFIFSPFKCDS